MQTEYDLSKMKSRQNPYSMALKKTVAVEINEDVMEYFRNLAEESGLSYQNVINLYLRDCVVQHRKINMASQR